MSARLAGWLFAGPALLVIALFFGVPVLAALALSVTDFDIYALADIGNLRFATAFGRGVDYYTGFEFELHHGGGGSEPLVGGGRYDGLLSQLGANEPIAAVGFSIWVDALARAVEGAA